jgi:hypothetical protein
MGLEWSDLDPRTWIPQVKSRFEKDFGPSEQDKADKAALRDQVGAAGDFANLGQSGFTRLGAEGRMARNYLRDVAEGRNSVSAEQLRQGMQQNVAAQQSLAASASPANAAMAARTAANNAARVGYGMSGQQAVAGLQERQNAQQLLNQMITQQRQQDLQAALDSRQQAIGGLTGQVSQQKSALEKYGPTLAQLAALAASDERLKHDVRDADDDSRKVIDGLKAYTFKYKDSKYGEGKQYGVMAQDLERAGLGHAVIDTPSGKMVHGAKLATSNTAMIAALGKRIAKLESK